MSQDIPCSAGHKSGPKNGPSSSGALSKALPSFSTQSYGQAANPALSASLRNANLAEAPASAMDVYTLPYIARERRAAEALQDRVRRAMEYLLHTAPADTKTLAFYLRTISLASARLEKTKSNGGAPDVLAMQKELFHAAIGRFKAYFDNSMTRLETEGLFLLSLDLSKERTLFDYLTNGHGKSTDPVLARAKKLLKRTSEFKGRTDSINTLIHALKALEVRIDKDEASLREPLKYLVAPYKTSPPSLARAVLEMRKELLEDVSPYLEKYSAFLARKLELLDMIRTEYLNTADTYVASYARLERIRNAKKGQEAESQPHPI